MKPEKEKESADAKEIDTMNPALVYEVPRA
jgi:hypothetical protein